MIDAAVIVATLASALMGGIFFAFSSFVMPALGRIPPAEGVRAMQRINIDVFHWSFMLGFFGTSVLSAVLSIQGVMHWGQSGSAALVLGGLAYIVGCFVVTVVGNVPLNNSLASVRPDEQDAASEWAAYARPWTRWNHVRTLFCMLAAAAFLTALLSN